MTDEGIKHRFFANIQGMATTFIGQENFSGNAHFTPFWISCTQSTGSNNGYLRRPAATETRHAGGESGTGKLDLPGHFLCIVVNCQAGTRPGNAIVLANTSSCRQGRIRICREYLINNGIGHTFFYQACIQVSRGAGATGRKVLTTGTIVSIHHQYPGFMTHKLAPLNSGTSQLIDDGG
jgi:hypothetical protein